MIIVACYHEDFQVTTITQFLSRVTESFCLIRELQHSSLTMEQGHILFQLEFGTDITMTYNSTNGLIGYVNAGVDGTVAANGTINLSGVATDVG